MDILGLPLHPLIVHAAVVLIPLAALGALAVVISGRLRQRYGWLTVWFALAAAVAAVAARLSGEALAASLGPIPAILAHEAWGQWVPFPAIALALLLPAGLLVRRRPGEGGPAWTVLAILIALVALACLGLVVLTGHSGATAVWGGLG